MLVWKEKFRFYYRSASKKNSLKYTRQTTGLNSVFYKMEDFDAMFEFELIR